MSYWKDENRVNEIIQKLKELTANNEDIKITPFRCSVVWYLGAICVESKEYRQWQDNQNDFIDDDENWEGYTGKFKSEFIAGEEQLTKFLDKHFDGIKI